MMQNDTYFTTRKSSLGWVLVAANKSGICSISLGDSAEDLMHLLQRKYPHTKPFIDSAECDKWSAAVIDYIDAKSSSLNLPLDIQGSPFQQRVWQAIQQIPRGKTASYTDIARQIGQPYSVRAVANACAANKLAVVIPCHRVVRQDGSLSGYRWGIERKRLLLECEMNK